MQDPDWLTEAETQEWKSVVGLAMSLISSLDNELKADAGMSTFEYHVLVALSEAPDRALPMSDLARSTWVSPSRLSHAVTRLEKAGWVRRVENTSAGRRTTAHLTETGWGKLHAAAPGHVRAVRALVLDALDPGELAALGAASRRILHRASASAPGCALQGPAPTLPQDGRDGRAR